MCGWRKGPASHLGWATAYCSRWACVCTRERGISLYLLLNVACGCEGGQATERGRWREAGRGKRTGNVGSMEIVREKQKDIDIDDGETANSQVESGTLCPWVCMLLCQARKVMSQHGEGLCPNPQIAKHCAEGLLPAACVKTQHTCPLGSTPSC